MKDMNLVTVKELYRNTDKYIDQTIEVGGWVRNIRDSKTFGFIVLNDGTTEADEMLADEFAERFLV